MRILVVSLLRIGDILISVPALRALRTRYPKARIDLLVNRPYGDAIKFLNLADRVIEFDRDFLQSSLISVDRPFFESFDFLNQLIRQLKSQNYQTVYNFTQNKLSGYIVSSINSVEQVGLSLNSKDQATFGSPWFRFVNDYMTSGINTVFHYTDIFVSAIGTKQVPVGFDVVESANGKMEVTEFFKNCGYRHGKKIVIQALTSDAKKNWPIDKWVEMIKKIKYDMPDSQVIVLSAPSEVKTNKGLISKLKESSIESALAVLSIEGAYSLLSVCDLLITGDTSIKHLAAATDIKILELSLGSSDLRKTGAYKEGSIIVKSREKCAPCDHQARCTQSSHLCGDSLAADVMGLIALALIRNDFGQIKVLAQEFEDEIEIYRTHFSKMGFWHADNLCPTFHQKNIECQIEKLTWKLLLSREHMKSLSGFGSASVTLSQELIDHEGLYSAPVLMSNLDSLEADASATEEKLERILGAITRESRLAFLDQNSASNEDDLQDEILKIEKKMGLGRYLSEKVKIDPKSGIYRIRQIQNSLQETFNFQKVKLKMIRNIKSHVREAL